MRLGTEPELTGRILPLGRVRVPSSMTGCPTSPSPSSAASSTGRQEQSTPTCVGTILTEPAWCLGTLQETGVLVSVQQNLNRKDAQVPETENPTGSDPLTSACCSSLQHVALQQLSHNTFSAMGSTATPFLFPTRTGMCKRPKFTPASKRGAPSLAPTASMRGFPQDRAPEDPTTRPTSISPCPGRQSRERDLHHQIGRAPPGSPPE